MKLLNLIVSFFTLSLALWTIPQFLPQVAAQEDLSWDDAEARMAPYDGPHQTGVDTSTLEGKVVVGYQGWFNTPTDGGGLDWKHYAASGGRFEPGSCSIDYWPDTSELDEDEKYTTPFLHADGRAAQVFSSRNKKTVNRHFSWMQQYGIDAAFVQRFAVSVIRSPRRFENCNVVLENCREGANRSGRGYIVMYDLSGMEENQIDLVIEDWKKLVQRMGITRGGADKAYLHHKGKPLVAVWGIGFRGDRLYTLDECARLVRFLKHDPEYGGCTVMLGVPTGFRTLSRDCLADPKVHEIIRSADIVSPWTPGRYRTLEGIQEHAQVFWKEDLEWCRHNGVEYLPVVFPGFSWHNLKKSEEAPLNAIPRLKGQFLWQQYYELQRLGAGMVYQAMFDEVDEGTQIFKVTNNPPVGASPFLTYEGLPSDHYLWLVGQAAKMIQGERQATEQMPSR